MRRFVFSVCHFQNDRRCHGDHENRIKIVQIGHRFHGNHEFSKYIF